MQTSIKDLKNHLSTYLKKVCQGEELIITSHHRPIARLLPLIAADEAINMNTKKINFINELKQLHYQLRNIKLKTSMCDTVLKQRNQERN